MRAALVAGLTWEPQIKGALYVAIAVLTLCGSCYLILATNMGARLGFLLAGAGLFGWLFTLGCIWWAYGRGPVGPDASWKSKGIITGELSASSNPALEGFPGNGWVKLDLTAPELADATPSASTVLTTNGPFKTANEFVVVGAYNKGGQRHGIFSFWPFDHRPLNVLHKPRYLVIQVQKAISVPNPSGGPPKLVADTTATPFSAVLIRSLGAKRLHPAVFAIACGIAFGLFCFQLHVRDKDATARRQAEQASGAGHLQPAGR